MRKFRPFPGKAKGFTLIELIVVITILAVLATLAAPSFRETIKTNRVISQSNELVALLNFAKSEAIRRGVNVEVVLTATANGWSGRVRDPIASDTAPGCSLGVIRCAENSRVILQSGTQTLSFNSRGYRAAADDFVFDPITLFLEHEDCRPGLVGQRRSVEILGTGQITSLPVDCSSEI